MNREERLEKFEILENLRTRNGTVEGIRYSTIARDLNLNPVTFTDWKYGRSMPKGDKIEKIAEYFGVPAKIFY